MPLNNFERIILGVDPGTNIMGYGILGVNSSAITPIKMGVITLKRQADSYLKLDVIFKSILQIIDTYLPDELAIEAPFYGKNVQSMLKLGRAQGVVMAAALSRDIPVREYEPRKVKLAVTGNGAASKEQVREMLRFILNIKKDEFIKELDASDALAIALCHYYATKTIISRNFPKSWKEFLAEHPERIKK